MARALAFGQQHKNVLRAVEQMGTSRAPEIVEHWRSNFGRRDYVDTLAGDRLVTDSLCVARHFGKQHRNVLQAIDALDCGEAYRLLNFQQTVATRPNPTKGGQPIASRVVQMTKNGFVFLVSGDQIVTNTRKVALALGKQHRNVVRIIDAMGASRNREIAQFNALNFERIDYVDSRGRTQRMFQMTKDGLVELAMGFTGEKACVVRIRFIAAFNAMAEQLQRRDRHVGH